MLGNLVALTLNYLNAVLAADSTFNVQVPYGMTVEKISVYGGDTLTCILDVGTVADTDAILDGVTFTGATGVSTVYDGSDFVDGQPMHVVAGTELVVTVDFDGGAGGSIADLSIVIWAREG